MAFTRIFKEGEWKGVLPPLPPPRNTCPPLNFRKSWFAPLNFKKSRFSPRHFPFKNPYRKLPLLTTQITTRFLIKQGGKHILLAMQIKRNAKAQEVHVHTVLSQIGNICNTTTVLVQVLTCAQCSVHNHNIRNTLNLWNKKWHTNLCSVFEYVHGKWSSMVMYVTEVPFNGIYFGF